MGVTGLWKLVEPCGQPVPLEILENKVLAVDISIWLHQVVKGFQDSSGSALHNAHLLGLFHRLCKLMYYRIKPVFVFDGKVPLLKRETIAKRNLKRNKLLNEADRIQTLLFQSLAKEKVVKQALGLQAAAELIKISPSKNVNHQKHSDVDDMYKLPDLPIIIESSEEDDSKNTSIESEVDETFKKSKNAHPNLQAIDVKSKHFRNLPADIRHEILVDIKETRKQSSWGKLHELPSKSNDFSVFQMERLLKRRQVQVSLEEAEKEMEGTRTVTLTDLENIFGEEGLTDSKTIPNSKHISSDSTSRYLFLNDLKKSLADGTAQDKPKNAEEQKSNLDGEEDIDLEKAIEMSLTQSNVYNEKDYQCEGKLRMNKQQRLQLADSAVGLARAYMIEHAELNDEQISNIFEQTQNSSQIECSDSLRTNEEKISINEDEVRYSAENTETKMLEEEAEFQTAILNSLQTTKLINKFTDQEYVNDEVAILSDSSSDFECVPVNSSTHSPNSNTGKMEIIVNTSKQLSEEEDIFADVFVPNKTETKVKSPSANVADILRDLKNQINEANKINLSDIKLDPSIIDISDSESPCCSKDSVKESYMEATAQFQESGFLKTELPHSAKDSQGVDIAELKNKTVFSTKLVQESNLNMAKDIFETKTPEKQILSNEGILNYTPPIFATPTSTKKLAPIFVTPNSAKKIENPSPRKTPRKAAKKLFEKSDTEDCKNKIKTINEDMQIILENQATVLRENKSREELEDIASNLAKEKIDLEKERNRQDRMGMSITEKMNSDCMHLLRLFGVPFIVAPMEAEAQCGFLDAINLTNGTITDDSDIWLFGGRTVYKNFFAQNKHVMEFKSDNIEKSFHVDRKKLIQLALLVGSDYTTGINGIGAVTALEILATFSTDDTKDSGSNQNSTVTLNCLKNFRNWVTSTKSGCIIGNSTRHRLRNKLKNIELSEGFPNSAVVEAYLTPTVDKSEKSFSWGCPDVESIIEFTRTNFGWTRSKTDDILGPVLKRLNEKKSQSSITNYFTVRSVTCSKQLQVSKRVKNAIAKMSNDYESEEEMISKTVRKAREKRKISTSGADTSDIKAKKEDTETKKKKVSNKSKAANSTESKKRPTPVKGRKKLPEKK